MMCEMMTSDDFTDVTLITDDKKSIKAHRIILSACSPVFKTILRIEINNSHPIHILCNNVYFLALCTDCKAHAHRNNN